MQQTVRRESPYLVLTLFTVSMVAGSMVYAGTGTLVPYIGEAFHLARAHLGVIATAMVLGGAATTVVNGVLCDKYGDKLILMLSGWVMGLALLGAAFFQGFAWLLVGMLVYGIGFAASNPAGSHAILFFFPREERGLAMGIRQTGVPLGGVCGAIAFSYFASHYGYRGALVFAGIAVIAISTIASIAYLQPSELKGDRVSTTVLLEDMLKIAREPRLLLVTLCAMLLFFVQSALVGFYPVTLIHAGGYAAALASGLFAFAHLSGAAGRLVWGRLSDRTFHGNRNVPVGLAAIGAALGALGLSGIGHVPMVVVICSTVLLGFAGEGWFGVSILAMAEIGGEEHAGGALGFGITGAFAAGIFAPLVFGWVAGTWDYSAAWLLTAVVGLAAAVPAFLAAKNPRRAPAR